MSPIGRSVRSSSSQATIWRTSSRRASKPDPSPASWRSSVRGWTPSFAATAGRRGVPELDFRPERVPDPRRRLVTCGRGLEILERAAALSGVRARIAGVHRRSGQDDPGLVLTEQEGRLQHLPVGRDVGRGAVAEEHRLRPREPAGKRPDEIAGDGEGQVVEMRCAGGVAVADAIADDEAAVGALKIDGRGPRIADLPSDEVAERVAERRCARHQAADAAQAGVVGPCADGQADMRAAGELRGALQDGQDRR